MPLESDNSEPMGHPATRRGSRKVPGPAILAVKRGFAVVGMNGKKPAEKWRDLGYREVDRLEREWPRDARGVGILTGPSGLVVLDLDVGEPDGWESLRKLARGRPIPATFTIRTPSGGTHLIFKAPKGRELKTCSGQVAPHVDVRAAGGLSVFDSGDPDRPYTVADDRDPVQMPRWLVSLCPERFSPNGHQPQLRGGIPVGQQHDVLLRKVWEWRAKGWSKKKASRAWRDLVRQSPLGRPGQPWNPAHFEEMWRGADEKQRLATRERAGLDAVRTGDWLDSQTFPPVRYAVDRILPEGLTVIAGPPKVGKSLFVLRIALECARGGKALGQACERRDVLYLALEDSDRRMQERCRDLLGGNLPIPPPFHYILDVEPGQLINTIIQWLETRPEPSRCLVLVDTLGKVMEPAVRGETTYERDYRITTDLKRVADDHPGLVIAVNHHTRKARSDDFVDLVSGTNGIAGAADTVFVLARRRGEPEGTLRITSREIDDAEYAMVMERPHGWQLDGNDLLEAAGNAATRRESTRSITGQRTIDLIAFVSKHPDGVTADEVSAALGITPGDARVYLKRSTDRGEIRRLERGVYGPIGKLRIIPNRGGEEPRN